jgi:hypothetical protein
LKAGNTRSGHSTKSLNRSTVDQGTSESLNIFDCIVNKDVATAIPCGQTTPLGLAHVDVTGLLRTQSTLLAATEGMDVHVGQLSQRLDVVEDQQEAQAVDFKEGRCWCGTLVESAPVMRSPGSLFEGFKGPWSGAVTESDEEVLPVPTIEEMRVWAGVREPEPEVSHSSSEAEALAWVE